MKHDPPAQEAYREHEQREMPHSEQDRLGTLILESSEAIIGGQTLREMLTACTQALVRHLDAAFARIWTLDDATNVLELQASSGMYTHLNGEHRRVPVGALKIGRIAARRAPHLTNAVIGDPEISDQEWAKREGMVAFAGYPLLVGERLIGVMAIFARHELSDAAMQAMATVANSIALGIERLRMQDERTRLLVRERAARAEAELAHQRLHDLFQQAPAVIGVLRGPHHVYELANPLFLQFVGQRAVIGKPIREALPELAGQGFYELLDRVYTTGEPFIGTEIPVMLDRHNDGRLEEVFFNFVYQPTRNAAGEVDGILMHAVDVTDQVRARQQLQIAEERLRLMAETMPQKVFTAKANGDVDYFNPQWTEFTGLSFAQIRDWGWLQFIHPDDVAENIRRWQHSIDTGEPFELEHRFRRADGVYHWHVSRAVPVRDARGQVTMWVGSNTDIDEQKRAEATLRAAEEQKEQFIAGVAHDLKSPLTTIKGMAQLLARQARRSATDEMTQALPRLQTIDDAVTRMIGMIDDLLDAARVRGGHALDLDRTATDLVALTRDVVAAQEQRAGGRCIAVETAAPAMIGQWDARRLERVLENLLSNACKYSPDGSAITVTLRRETDDAGAWAVLTVTDRGIGIPAADLPHIFERFYRAGNAARVTGSGIGLVGAKQIIEQHGGTITITSAEGQGTTVTVRLPLAESAEC